MTTRKSHSIVDDVHKCFIASFNYRNDAERHWMQCAHEDLARYISTGRASADWLRAFRKADKTKLLRRMAEADDKSSDAQISVATAYLRRYCRY